MAAGGVSREFATHNSGHDNDAVSKLDYYQKATLKMLVPGLVVLAGWKNPVPYGQTGAGPVPATLNELIENGSATEQELDEFTDLLLWLRSGFTAPCMLVGGDIRFFSRALAATLIMYYAESTSCGEVVSISLRMRNSMCDTKLAASQLVGYCENTVRC
jgi:hypothetical protein